MMYLLTAKPRTGKSTAIKSLVTKLNSKRCIGFYTEEIKADGERVGFQINTLSLQLSTMDLTIIGTIFYESYPWIDDLKQKKSVNLIELTVENRENIIDKLYRLYFDPSLK